MGRRTGAPSTDGVVDPPWRMMRSMKAILKAALAAALSGALVGSLLRRRLGR
jgi:hypothetical protein